MSTAKEPTVLRRITVPAGKTFIKQGDAGSTGYAIQSGKVEVYLEEGGENITIATLGPGDVVGEQATLYDSSRSASVKAVTECNLVILNRNSILHSLSKADPSVRAMIKILSQRVKSTTRVLVKEHQEHGEKPQETPQAEPPAQ